MRISFEDAETVDGEARHVAIDSMAPTPLISMGKAFSIALRGYDLRQVDRLLDRAELALATDDQGLRQPPRGQRL